MEKEIEDTPYTYSSFSKFNSKISTSNVNFYDIGHYLNQTVSNELNLNYK